MNKKLYLILVFSCPFIFSSDNDSSLDYIPVVSEHGSSGANSTKISQLGSVRSNPLNSAQHKPLERASRRQWNNNDNKVDSPNNFANNGNDDSDNEQPKSVSSGNGRQSR